MKPCLIPFPENNTIFERVKASGFNRSQMCPYWDMDPFAIVESRELSRSSNMVLFFGNGIRRFIYVFFIALFTSLSSTCYSLQDTMFWWKALDGVNFGDDLSRVIVEKILDRPIGFEPLSSDRKLLFAVGSILHYARDGDVIWGSGFRENPLSENRFHSLDVRSVRGPRTREYLLKMGISCPEIYGDPAVLMGYLFPEFKKEEEPIYDYIIIPNIGEIQCFTGYKNVVLPTWPWDEIVKKMMQSRLVISSSLHGIIVAESFGIPTRQLKMTWIEPLLKYQDYYESSGRPNFRYATSVQEALQMGGEEPCCIDINLLIEAFPWDYFRKDSVGF